MARTPFNSDNRILCRRPDSLVNPETTQEYEAYIARLRDVPRYFDENIANARAGMRDGFTLPAVVLDGLSNVVAAAQCIRAEDSPLWRHFSTFPDGVSQADRARLAAMGREALAVGVLPAYASFQRFFHDEYRPAARTTIGASALPDGRAYYDDLVRYFTTQPDATPEEIHRIGSRKSRAFAAKWKRSCAGAIRR